MTYWQEMALTVALYFALGAAALFGDLAGLLLALAWIGVGVWMVSRSQSRGFIADASFVVTWPLYVLLEG